MPSPFPGMDPYLEENPLFHEGICHSRNSWWQSEDPDFFRARNGAGKDAPGQRRVRISGRIPAAIFPA